MIKYLESKNLKVWESGKNVTKGWVNIKCQYCSDKSNHLGISLKTHKFSCWKCHETGSMIDLIMLLEPCNYQTAKKTYENFLSPTQQFLEPKIRKETISLTGLTKDLHKKACDYLKSRNFCPEYLSWKYDLYFGGRVGDFKWRVVTPFKFNRLIVCLSGRDITDKQSLKYRHLADDKSILTPKETLYNIDNCTGDNIGMFEGYTDVWRFGDNTVSNSGVFVTEAQIKQLRQKGIKKIYFMYDTEPDAQEKATADANKLSAFFNVEIIKLDAGDPAELSNKNALLIKKELKL